MKRIAAFFVLSVLCAPLAARAQSSAPAAQPATSAPGAAAPQAPQGRKKRVAVFDFDYATVKTNSAALFGTDIDVGKGIADLLVKNLVTDGTYSVIERKQLDKILAEQNFSNSDRANPASAAKIGKILGLDAIIVGHHAVWERDQRIRISAAAAAASADSGSVGLATRNPRPTSCSMRVSWILTPRKFWVWRKARAIQRSSKSAGRRWQLARLRRGRGGLRFERLSTNHHRRGREGRRRSNDRGRHRVGAQAAGARIIKVEGLIAAVDGDQIVLNVGAKTGVKVGDHLSVERVTSTIKDPATGAVLRKMTSKVGEVQVTDVDDISAVCKPLSGNGFKIGDVAKTVTQ